MHPLAGSTQPTYTVGDSVSFPFKELRKDDWVKVTLQDKRFFVVYVTPSPEPDTGSLQNGHKISLRIAGRFTQWDSFTNELGALRNKKFCVLSQIHTIPTSGFEFEFWNYPVGSIDYDPQFRFPRADRNLFLPPVAIEKIEKITLKVLRSSLNTQEEKKEVPSEKKV